MRFGIHNAKTSKIIKKKYKDIHESIQYEAELLGLSASQIFTHGPRNYNKNKINYKKTKKYCRDNNIALYVHGNYGSVGIWKVNHKNKNKDSSQRIIKHVIDMLNSCSELGALGLVIHLKKAECEVFLESLDILSVELAKTYDLAKLPYLLLEMPAMSPDPTKSYETPGQLNNLCRKLRGENLLPWGLCIDTSHQWAGGIDFSAPLSWEKWIGELEPESEKKIKLIHLNGSLKRNFNTGKDTHIIPFSEEDAIWGNYINKELRFHIDALANTSETNIPEISPSEMEELKLSSFCSIVKYYQSTDVDIICEINRGEFHDTKFCMEMIKSFTS